MNDYHTSIVHLFAELPSIDAWFPARTVVQLHNGCAYLCHYCPANWQKQKILLHNPIIKENHRQQFFSAIKKKQSSTVIGLGAGYTDPFPPENTQNNAISQQYEKTLELLLFELLENSHHLLIMTKNPQKLLQLLEKFSKKMTNTHFSQITLICSIIFPDNNHRHFAILEPQLPLIEERWKALGLLKKLGVSTGIAYLPIIGGVNDDEICIQTTLERGKKENIDFCLFGELSENACNYLAEKKIVSPTKIVKSHVEIFFIQTLEKLKILPLPPLKKILPLLSKRDLSIVYLKQLYLYQNWRGKNKKHFLNAALSLEKIDDAFFQSCCYEQKKGEKSLSLRTIHQIGPKIENLLKTLIFKKKTTYLEDLSKFFR